MFVNPISPKKNPLAIISGVTGKEERQHQELKIYMKLYKSGMN